MPTRKETIAKYRRIIGNTVMYSKMEREAAEYKMRKLINTAPKTQRRPKQEIERSPEVETILKRTRERRVKRGASIGG